jgi:hypothetical protein
VSAPCPPLPFLGSVPSSLVQSSAAIYATPSRGGNGQCQRLTLRPRRATACALSLSRTSSSTSTLHWPLLPFRVLEREILPRGMAASRAWLARATAAAVLGFVLVVASAEAASGDVEMVFLKAAVAKGAGACSAQCAAASSPSP